MTSVVSWGSLSGISIMKFTLTYEGELRSNDDYRRKWEIRNRFHPQMQELWKINSALQGVLRNRYVPVGQGGWMSWETHHDEDNDNPMPMQPPDESKYGKHRDLCEPIIKGGRKFMPLVRNSFALRCGLSILFLRREPPGKVYQGGDIDNRLKTLFDALSVPNPEQIVDDRTVEDPIYCLLEDDSLISRIDVDTRQLLSRPNGSKHDVHLVIEVDVRAINIRQYNQFFLGD